MITKTLYIQGLDCKSGGCVRQAVELISGALPFAVDSRLRAERSVLTGRQKNHPEQLGLALVTESRSEAPRADTQRHEPLMAKHKCESPADTEALMEEVCERENCQQALRRVKADRGSPGVDGMTVPPDADPHVRWCGRGVRLTAPPMPIFKS